jgi:tetratricopeptide (TPR) repeat protein
MRALAVVLLLLLPRIVVADEVEEHMAAAQKARQQGDWDTAYRAYLAARDAGNINAVYDAANMFFGDAKDPRRALAAYRSYISLAKQAGLSEAGPLGTAMARTVQLETQAREYAKLGAAYMNQGSPAQAIPEFEKANAIDPSSDGYVQLGAALEKLGRRRDAVKSYEEARRHPPESRHDAARERIAVINSELEKAEQAAADQATEAARLAGELDTLDVEMTGWRVAQARTTADRAGELASLAEKAAAASDEAARITTTPQAVQLATNAKEAAARARTVAARIAERASLVRDPSDGKRTLRLAGLVTGGAGVVVLGAGVAFGLVAAGHERTIEGWQAGDPFDPAEKEAGEAANRNMYLCVGIGAALVATGVTLYVLGSRTDTEGTSVSFAPSLSGGSVVLSGSF